MKEWSTMNGKEHGREISKNAYETNFYSENIYFVSLPNTYLYSKEIRKKIFLARNCSKEHNGYHLHS